MKNNENENETTATLIDLNGKWQILMKTKQKKTQE